MDGEGPDNLSGRQILVIQPFKKKKKIVIQSLAFILFHVVHLKVKVVPWGFLNCPLSMVG